MYYQTKEYEIEWFGEKGTYKDENNKSFDVTLNDIDYYNNFLNLERTIISIFNIFKSPMQYFNFWNIKLNIINNFEHYFFPNNDFKSLEFTWFTNKIVSSSSVFLNELMILLETMFAFSKTKLFDSRALKNALLVHSHSVLEAFVTSINVVYTAINIRNEKLITFDQKLNKIRNFEDFDKNKNDLLQKELNENFKNKYYELCKIRNIIVHPFSYKETKNDYSYWQIEYFNKTINLDNSSIQLIKMNQTNVKNKDWIVNSMEIESFEEKKFNFLNLINELLEEMLNYFKKEINDSKFVNYLNQEKKFNNSYYNFLEFINDEKDLI